MPKLNPALFNPLTRIENACRRASGIMLTAPNPPKDCRLVWREIQEIRDALEAFKAAAEAGEMTGFKDGAIRSHETEPSKAFRHSISKASGEGSKEASRSRAQFRKEVTESASCTAILSCGSHHTISSVGRLWPLYCGPSDSTSDLNCLIKAFVFLVEDRQEDFCNIDKPPDRLFDCLPIWSLSL
jgi:hypothetical protein